MLQLQLRQLFLYFVERFAAETFEVAEFSVAEGKEVFNGVDVIVYQGVRSASAKVQIFDRSVQRSWLVAVVIAKASSSSGYNFWALNAGLACECSVLVNQD